MRFSKLTLGGLAAALLLSTAPAAFAAGTTAGTAVLSTVNISFTRGSTTVDDTASVTFYVDRKVDFLTESTHSGNVLVDLGAPASDFTGALVFTLENTSNASIDYAITTAGAVPGAGATGSVTSHSLEISRDNGDTWAAVGATETLAEDEEVQVRVVATFAPDSNGTFEFEVSAAPAAGFGVETGRDILESGAANMNTIHLFASADTSDTATFEVSSPTLTATKAVSVIHQNPPAGFDCALDGGPGAPQAAIPGACIEYLITVNNTGGAAMRNLVVIDDLPAQVSYAGWISGDFTVAVDGNQVTGTMTGNLTAAESAVLRIRAIID